MALRGDTLIAGVLGLEGVYVVPVLLEVCFEVDEPCGDLFDREDVVDDDDIGLDVAPEVELEDFKEDDIVLLALNIDERRAFKAEEEIKSF